MAAPTIPNGEEHFFVTQYEGNGAAQRVGRFVPFTDSGVISNSCIFNATTNNYLARTPSSNGSGTTLTFSCWVKRGLLGLRDILYNGNITSNSEHLHFDANNKLNYYEAGGGARKWNYVTTRTFEDTSKWYHIYVRRDTTDSTAADRIQIYVDGERVTAYDTETQPALNATGYWNQTSYGHYLGTTGSASYIRGIGYLAEINMVDGSNPAISTFGLTDTSTGRWIPKALTGITYGTNGFRLQFGSPSAIGDDTSGNNNDWSVNDLVASDLTTDSPTQNHATLNVNPTASGGTLSEGNLKLVTNNTGYNVKYATLKPTSGKYYAEFTIGSGGAAMIGVQDANVLNTATSSYFPYGYGYGWYEGNGNVYDENVAVVLSGTSYTSGDVIAMALDLDNQILKWYKNNSLTYTAGLNGTDIVMAVGDYANADDATITCNFGQKSFTYTPPTGFVALQQDNLPETSKGITGLVWIKDRDNALNWNSYDSSNGIFNRLVLNNTESILATQGGVTRFLKGGVAVGDTGNVNNSGATHVSYNWVANNGTTVTNNDGSQTSTVQANPTAGFSVVTYAGTSSGTATIGHGLSSAPQWMIIKNLTDNTRNWFIYHHRFHSSTPQNYYAMFTTAAPQTGDVFNNTAPTSSVFSIQDAGSLNTNGSGKNYVAYCWHEVDGFSKFGKYTGTGSNPGPFIYTGFKVRWLLHKSNNGASWYLYDSVTQPLNPVLFPIFPDTAAAASSNIQGIDFLSNGFKLRQGNGYGANYPGVDTYYMAFAEHPFVGDGTNPTTAR